MTTKAKNIKMKTETISANEEIVREAYRTAEVKDIKGFISLFTDDGYFWDVSAGIKYYGSDVAKPIEVYAEAFPDMHRELLKFFIKEDENVVIHCRTHIEWHTQRTSCSCGRRDSTDQQCN